jgi:hypothetical protein
VLVAAHGIWHVLWINLYTLTATRTPAAGSDRTSSMASSGWNAVVPGSMMNARLMASTTPSVAAHLHINNHQHAREV